MEHTIICAMHAIPVMRPPCLIAFMARIQHLTMMMPRIRILMMMPHHVPTRIGVAHQHHLLQCLLEDLDKPSKDLLSYLQLFWEYLKLTVSKKRCKNYMVSQKKLLLRTTSIVKSVFIETLCIKCKD